LPRKIAVPIICVSLVGFVTIGRFMSPQFAPLVYWSDPIILEFVLGVAIALLYKQYDVRLPGALRLCLIIFGAAAAV